MTRPPICRFAVPFVASLSLTAPASAHHHPLRDTPFWQDYREDAPLGSDKENDVRAIAVDRTGRVWAATAIGVRVRVGAKWVTPPGGDMGPTYSLLRDGAGGMRIGAWKGLYRGTKHEIRLESLAGKRISVLAGAPHSAKPIAGGPDGIFLPVGNGWSRLRGRWTGAIRSMDAAGDLLWIGTSSGLYRHINGSERTVRYGKPAQLLSSNIHTVRYRPDGSLWIGSTGGIDVYRNGEREKGIRGLPNHRVSDLQWDGLGRLWVATKLGVARYDGKRWALRHSLRWLPSDDVRSIAMGPDGTAWVATDKGVSAIRRKRMTLAEKADYYLGILRKYNLRPPGLVGPANLKKPGDLSEFSVGDTDNDGQWTSYYCVAECFRYAVTHDPQARANARDAFHALEFLQTVTGTPHFVARTAVPIDVPPLNDLNHTHTPHEIADIQVEDPRYKPVDIRWRPSKDGKWLWKGDTSSDEIDGHMYAYATYFDLAADPTERKRVAAVVEKIIGGIVDNGFYLVDTDGKHTRWGVWAPQSLNDDENWHEERGNNSAELLAHLNAAYHITHNPKYLLAKRQLIEKHGYARNALLTDYSTPAEHTHIVDSLLHQAYPNLVSYETDAKLKRIWQESLRLWHKTVARDKRFMYDSIYVRFTGLPVDLRPALEDLRDWPLDLIDWTVDNRTREDVTWDHTPGLEEELLNERLPAGERGITESDGDPHAPLRGNGGSRLYYAHVWLHEYWQARYYGLLR